MKKFSECAPAALREFIRLGKEKHPELKEQKGSLYTRGVTGVEYSCFIGFAALGAGVTTLEQLRAYQAGTRPCVYGVAEKLMEICSSYKRAAIELALNDGVQAFDRSGMDAAIATASHYLEKVEEPQ